jgi:Rad3-related DNA helicase
MEYEDSSKKYFKFTCEGYNVKFPFEPYDCQKEIIKSILNGLVVGNSNAIIESPTGTGKCLSALSAVFAYLESLSRDKSYLEEKKLHNKVKNVLCAFDEIRERLIKLYKNFKIQSKKNSLQKTLDFFREIINSQYDEIPDELSLNIIYLNWEKVANYSKKILAVISRDILNIFKCLKYEEDSLREIELNFEDYLEKLEICQNKLKDKLKMLKHCHSVIYAVRTSSQIDIVYEESQKIKEKKDKINIAYLKSRNFYCINEDLKNHSGVAKIRICNKKYKSCQSYKEYFKSENINSYFDPKLIDYKCRNICPYFNEKNLSTYSEITVCSYNHLLSRATRSDFFKYTVNPIIIFDEAHNLPNACEEFLNYKFEIKELLIMCEKVFDISHKLNLDQYLLSNENENSDESLLPITRNFLLLVLIVINNLIFLNQTSIDMMEAQNFESPKLNKDINPFRKSDYRSTSILELFALIFSWNHFESYEEENFNYFENPDCTDQNNLTREKSENKSLLKENNVVIFAEDQNINLHNKSENSPECKNIETKRKLLNKFNSSFITLKNSGKLIKDFLCLNDKSIDLEEKLIPNFEKFINFLSLLFETLLFNYERVLTASSHSKNQHKKTSNQKLYIDDYYLTVSNVDFLSNQIDLAKNFYNYKDCIFEEQILLDLIAPDVSISELEDFFKILNNFIMIDKRFESKYINLICMNPAICFQIMKNDLKPKSINLLSGTMSPFQYYSDQLEQNFSNQLENEHIINNDQVEFFVFTSSLFSKESFEISFTKNNQEKLGEELFIESLKIIISFSINSGAGNLIFVKTYSTLESLVSNLKSLYSKDQRYTIKEHQNCLEIFEKKKLMKRFYLDSREIDSSIKENIMNNYKKSCAEGKKSYLISVMRGLFSEGVNFENEESSMIFILGMPLPDITDDYIRLKMNYISEKYHQDACSFDGDEWYYIQAMTALNQALGRSIRRKNDYSSICILESKILPKKRKKLLSKWIQNIEMNIVDRYNYSILKAQNKNFYKKHLKSFSDNRREEYDFVNEFYVKETVSTCKVNKMGNTGFVTFSFK